jgi:hypothetical protein
MGVFLGFPHRISRTPLVQRRGAALARLIAKARAGLHLNNYTSPSPATWCSGTPFEGIVSKRLGSPYVSGRLPQLAEVREPGSTGR